MGHTYIRLDFGTDEEKAQQARHKLDGWRQAFRLDKKLQYKLERPESEAADGGAAGGAESAVKASVAESAGKAAKEEKGKSGSKGASKGKEAGAAKVKAGDSATKAKAGDSAEQKPAANGKVGLLVRLYFSSHEKLSEQRWIERIPMEEPFKNASPKVIHSDDAEFEKTDQQFETMEKKTVKYP
jgi:hypothetical protein